MCWGCTEDMLRMESLSLGDSALDASCFRKHQWQYTREVGPDSSSWTAYVSRPFLGHELVFDVRACVVPYGRGIR